MGNADGLKHIDRAADIGIKSRFGIVVGIPHQGLGRQMKDDFRFSYIKGFCYGLQITNIAFDMVNQVFQSNEIKMVRFGIGGQGKAGDMCAEFMQP